jgi:hypothetical protein
MQVAACQPVGFCLEYNLRQDEHAVTGNTVHLNSWLSVSRRWGLDADVEWRQRRMCRSSFEIIARPS